MVACISFSNLVLEVCCVPSQRPSQKPGQHQGEETQTRLVMQESQYHLIRTRRMRSIAIAVFGK